jgi:hypothetical protein
MATPSTSATAVCARVREKSFAWSLTRLFEKQLGLTLPGKWMALYQKG